MGRGSGEFDYVGTPRKWLWPLFSVLSRAAIAFPVWERHVPFEVVNVPGDGAVRATIAFGLGHGARVMRHEVRMSPRGLIDVLGTRGRFVADLSVEVVEGHLEVRSTALRLRLARRHIPVPLAPRIVLLERSDGNRQRVEFAMTAPLIGRIYSYAGTFDYRIEAS